MTMKFPKYFIPSGQDQIDAGINHFGAQLLAESFADDGKPWKDETVVIVAKAHNGTEVYMVLSTERPTVQQFEGWPK